MYIWVKYISDHSMLTASDAAAVLKDARSIFAQNISHYVNCMLGLSILFNNDNLMDLTPFQDSLNFLKNLNDLGIVEAPNTYGLVGINVIGYIIKERDLLDKLKLVSLHFINWIEEKIKSILR